MQERGLDPNDQNVRTAVFGREVELFLESSLGEYLVAHAQHEVTDALRKLKTVDPMDVGAVRDLQYTIRRGESFIGWLGEAVQAGRAATGAIDAEEEMPDAT